MKATIYNASAGSGKTYRLAYKYIRDVIETPTLYRHILAVTFTNKATEEMKRRILRHIHNLASGLPCDYLGELERELGLSPSAIRARAEEARTLILHNYSRFTVLTIDKFFQRVLRAFIQELGIDIDYSLEIDTSPIITQSADALVEDERLREWLMELAQERINEGRKWDIREGILALKDELFKEEAREALEGARTKEELREIVSKMEHRASEGVEKIIALSRSALQRIDDDCEQFKGGGNSSPALVFRRIANCGGVLPTLTDSQIGARDNIDKWLKKGVDTTLATEMMGRLDEIVGLYLSEIGSINTSKLLNENFRSFALMHDLYQKTQELCREQNTMLLSQTSRILAEFIEESDAPFIYEKVGNRYSRFMIDEFQDTSRREWDNFTPLLRDAIAQSQPDENPVLIVGDIKQSIYRWRGGDWRILHSDVERELGHHNSRVINMVDNYRSLPGIVRFNNEIIECVVTSENETLNAELQEAYNNTRIDQQCKEELTGIVRSAYTDHSQNPKHKGDREGYVELTTHTDDEPPIISTICSAIDRGYRPYDIMVLTRTNTEASRVAQALLEFKQENPDPKYRFDVMTQEALVVGRSPVSHFLIATLHLSLNPADTLQRAIYNRFLGYDLVDREFEEEEGEFLHSLRMLSPLEAFEMIVMRYDLSHQSQNIAYVQAIHEQVITYTKSKIGDISLFLEWWHEKGTKQSLRVEKSTNSIEILTIHKAKGLEKRVVILPYCNWKCDPQSSGINKNFVWAESNDEEGEIGKFPIQYKSTMRESSFAEDYYREKVYTRIDNINVLYVALTRAVESLHIFVKVSEKGVGTGIGELLLRSLPSLTLGVIEQCESGSIRYTLSEPSTPAEGDDDDAGEPFIMQSYVSTPSQLRLRMPTQRYREDGDEEFTPREMGILMHKAFEQSKSRAEIMERIESMLNDGQINKSEHKALTESIEESLSHPLAREWFDGEWDAIRNESEIIRPNEESSRRPDRVMIRGNKAVVVDYKFGEQQSAKYQRQMRLYMSLLRQMGHTEVEGYIWYVRSNEIERVD